MLFNMLNIIRANPQMNTFTLFLAIALSLIIALTVHEASHAFVAYKSGDLTAKAYGRLTLNPFKHMDPVGTVLLFLVGFGWAKPVPINRANFKRGKRDFFWVSSAGILSNIVLAFISVPLMLLVSKFLYGSNFFFDFLYYFLYFSVFYNISLAIFNLLPFYPLDGFNIVLSLSRRETGYIRFNMQYGNILLIIFVIFFSSLIFIPVNYIYQGFYWVWNLLIRV